jgi:tetraacyldisaccharide 4'-kinase
MTINWIEQYLFNPNIFQRLIGIFFLPVTLFYCIITAYKRMSAKPKYYNIPVISIGNLVVGGTGKTPLTKALIKDKKDIAIILRGYGRVSKGLYVVSNNGKILEDIAVSGDEAMEYAKECKNATVIVSEDRVKAIQKAKDLNCKVIYLDDGYSQHNIVKYNILIRPKEEPKNIFCLPSGGYRDTPMMYSFCDCVIKEDVDFKRMVTFKNTNGENIENLPKNIVLVTAISKPYRLKEFLPKDIKSMIFVDHHMFTQNDIDTFYKKYPNHSIVTTKKDMVKLEQFNLQDLYLMDLKITVKEEIYEKIDNYIKKGMLDENR